MNRSAMLPDRLLTCIVGRARGLDPSKLQTNAEVSYEGAYPVSLRLPAIARRTTAPPDPFSPAEPVNPATRIVTDPAGLMADVPAGFERVVDLWPMRVELSQTIAAPLSSLVIVTDIDEPAAAATVFIARVKDAASFDLDRVYQGRRSIKTTDAE